MEDNGEKLMCEKVEGWQGMEDDERIAVVLGRVCIGIRQLEVWCKGCGRSSSIKLVKWVTQSGVISQDDLPLTIDKYVGKNCCS